MSRGKDNSVRRSRARGLGARGTTAIPDTGREAYEQSRKSTQGQYRVQFVQSHDRATDRDVELREVYGKELVAGNIGVPADMITLQIKKEVGEQTLTSLDEVYYVKVGTHVYGKLSIRTQRVMRHTDLIFIYQEKQASPKPPRESFNRKNTFDKKTKSQVSQTRRDSYHRGNKGTR